jgi:hypothetical protein
VWVALVSALLPDAQAASFWPASYLRETRFQQTDAVTLVDVRHQFTVSTSALPTSGPFVAPEIYRLTAPTRTTYQLAFDANAPIYSSSRPSYSKEFSDLPALNREFPNGAYLLVASTQFINSVTLNYDLTANGVLLTNFDTLQAWPGGPLTIAWKAMAGATESDSTVLQIARADGTIVYSSFSTSAGVRLNGRSTSAVATNVVASAGEVLRATLTTERKFASTSADLATVVQRNIVQFPIVCRASLPVIAAGPEARTVKAGDPVALAVSASGTAPLTFQWQRNGVALAGATQSTLTLDRARPSDSGQYSVTIANSAGSITSGAAELSVLPVTRISNLSILTSLNSATDNFTLGFVVRGAHADADGAKPILIRAVGPSLAPLGVQGTLDDPRLELFAGSIQANANDNWGGGATLTNTFTSIGAFAFANPGSRDAAVATRVSDTTNSFRISGTGIGIVLAELYDATLSDDFEVASPRFANVTVLKQIGNGLTTGFIIDGVTPLRVLVRAIGPTLASFGVTGVVADPKLDLFHSGSAVAIAVNDNWSAAANAVQVAAAAANVGAFALAADTRDAALLVTLPPGSYTAQVSGVNSTSGTAIVEVYEVP